MMRSRSVRWAASLVAVALLLAGCGDTDDTGSADEAEAEVLATVEGFGAALNTYDTEAIREYVTDDFTSQSSRAVETLDEYLASIDTHYQAAGFLAEATSDPVVTLDGAEYVVVQQDAVKATGLDAVGTSTYRLVEVDGEWLIREARWVEEAAGSTE